MVPPPPNYPLISPLRRSGFTGRRKAVAGLSEGERVSSNQSVFDVYLRVGWSGGLGRVGGWVVSGCGG